MKKWWWLILLVIVANIALVIALGPRVSLDAPLNSVDLPADLPAYLATAEADFADDLVPGAEKTIIWANPATQEKTPYAMVYVHGFSASRQETAPMTDQVAEALGANLFYTRLAGHGRDGQAMTDGSMAAWAGDMAEAMAIGEQLGEKVILVGVSTGGSLATWLAAQPQYADDIAAVVLMSPNFGPRDSSSEILLLPWGQQIAEMIIGPERGWEPSNEMHARYWTERYPTRALLPMMASVELARTAPLETMQQPVLILYSENDTVVDPAKTAQVLDRLGSQTKVMIAVENSDDEDAHVLAGDIMSPSTTNALAAEILSFLKDAGIQ